MNQKRLEIAILVRGANDVGSAVAHLLFRTGYAVTIHEMPQPKSTRRKMSFTDAVFDGSASLDGVAARLVEVSDLSAVLFDHQIISIVVQDMNELVRALQPQIVVDARMRKHVHPEVQRDLAALTIGLGPNFIAGETVELAIETGWGDSLGQVIHSGATADLQGEPVVEVDPRTSDAQVFGIGERPARIAEGVLAAIQHWEFNHVH